jgi:hypothetical protein
MAYLKNNLSKTLQISVEMGDLTLTKLSGRLKVNIGAVLRTRMNTGVCLPRKRSRFDRWKT